MFCLDMSFWDNGARIRIYINIGFYRAQSIGLRILSKGVMVVVLLFRIIPACAQLICFEQVNKVENSFNNILVMVVGDL